MLSVGNNCKPGSRLKAEGNHYGFTLIEIIIVLLFMGMAVVMVAPSVRSGIDNMRFRTSVRQLVSTLRYCRSKAISTKEKKEVEIDLDEAKYRPRFERLPADEDMPTFYEDKGPPPETFPDGVVFTEWETLYDTETGGIQVVSFFPKGNATGGTLRIEDLGGRPWEVVIGTITGRVKVVRPDED
jgi:type II secretory pathway pseudopilin PulG